MMKKVESVVTEDLANITIVPEQINSVHLRLTPTVRLRSTSHEHKAAGNQMKEAFNMLKNVLTKRPSNKKCDLFGKMMAKKLRKLPEHERDVRY